ncbi:MAG: DNA double-strand break repair helicase HerA [Candidatus Micrarchaeota archaeon]|nr:MAG: DNA double-strand break repair helicase HerA [Candidatus Micrarchaeota archaeon]
MALLDISKDIGPIDANIFASSRVFIIGQSGSGKSYLVGVILEELIKNNISFIVFDTEGEYTNIKTDNVIIISSENGDIDFNISFDALMRSILENNLSLIVDLSLREDKVEICYSMLDALYKAETLLKRPIFVFIEEADIFAPQTPSSQTNSVENISFRGRKRGISLFVITQRPSRISKNVLSQCNLGFIGRMTIANDINALRFIIDDESILDGLKLLKPGQFYFFGYANKVINIRDRKLQHISQNRLIEENRSITDKDSIIKMLKKSEQGTDNRAYIKNSIKTDDYEELYVIEDSIDESRLKRLSLGDIILRRDIYSIKDYYIKVKLYSAYIYKNGRYLKSYVVVYGDKAISLTKGYAIELFKESSRSYQELLIKLYKEGSIEYNSNKGGNAIEEMLMHSIVVKRKQGFVLNPKIYSVIANYIKITKKAIDKRLIVKQDTYIEPSAIVPKISIKPFKEAYLRVIEREKKGIFSKKDRFLVYNNRLVRLDFDPNI